MNDQADPGGEADTLDRVEVRNDKPTEADEGTKAHPTESASPPAVAGIPVRIITLAILISSPVLLLFVLWQYYDSQELVVEAGFQQGNPMDSQRGQDATATDSKKASAWTVHGQVMFLGKPVPGASVRLKRTDDPHVWLASAPSTTDEKGAFSITLPEPAAVPPDVLVEAKSPGKWTTRFFEKKSQLILNAQGIADKARQLVKSGSSLILLAILVFAISVGVSFGRPQGHLGLRLQYGIVVFCAGLLSAGIVISIGWALYRVQSLEQTEGLNVGVASIYKGGEGNDQHTEWFLSLTSPPTPSQKPLAAFRAMRVPLWVLLISVVGAALLTVSIILAEARNVVDFSKSDDVRERIHKLVEHQFFLLFSPLGGVFVYQALVVADAVSQPITVAVAALGAGASLNILLERAVAAAGNAWGKSTETKGK